MCTRSTVRLERTLHFTHTARTERADDLVPPDSRTRCPRHRCELYHAPHRLTVTAVALYFRHYNFGRVHQTLV